MRRTATLWHPVQENDDAASWAMITREERMGKPWPKPFAWTEQEKRELSRLAIQYVLARDKVWRFAEELERRNSDSQE